MTSALAFDARPGKSLIRRTSFGVMSCELGQGQRMCVVDAAAKEAAVARFLREYPETEQAEYGHPALVGCTDVAWSQIPGCPAELPALLRGLLDQVAGPEALRVLDNVLMNSVFHVSPALSAALPFLIRLAALPDIAVRSGLVDLLVVAAELSQPVDADNERRVLLLGNECDHPEREWCRAAFAAHAPALRALLEAETLPDGLISAADRECLLRAAEPQRYSSS
ncbi:hypothetical protein [Streptomyces durhamensis]|uniref:hypothetical protein n=1 Tax=Streptomyces durhamensis TaxID=68194 RepID=UPI0012FF28CC|nr:hypothetical protein [Streptomyces durhamensis]